MRNCGVRHPTSHSWETAMESKQCFRCSEAKPLTDYYVIKDRRRGVNRHGGVCKACNAQSVRSAYAARTEDQKKAQQEKQNEYSRRPENILRKKMVAKNRRLRNLEAERERGRLNFQQNRDAILAYQRANKLRAINNLSSGYLNCLLGGSSSKNFPAELLEAKRLQIEIRRALKQTSQTNQAPQGAST